MIEITAEALIEEFIADRRAPSMKYRGKTLRVTGELKRVAAAGLTFAGKSVGTMTYQLSVIFPPAQRTGLSALKAGDKATVEAKVGSVTTTQMTVSLQLTEVKLVN